MKLDELLTLIKSEIKPTMGCTEPAAIGFAVSNTCMHLNKPANKIKLKLSSNIVKNAYCVTIPNTNLLTIRQKYMVGRLSPIYGATLSGASSAAVITWLLGGSYKQMEAAMRTMYATV